MPDALAALLAAGERAAFHGRPDAGTGPLTEAVELARAEGRDAEVAAASWLLGVCLAASGSYGQALAVLDPLVGDVATPERRVFAALAAATVGSVHRQLGRHAVAQGYDETALETAQTAEGRFDAVLGLAADAVGQGEAAVAHERVEEAVAEAGEREDWWRQRVRLDWVRAEVAMLEDDAVSAVTAAHRAVELAEVSGAPRHVAKGLLFLGLGQVQAGRETEAAMTLRRGALLAESLGTLPLQWPVRAVLGALVADTDDVESTRCLTLARRAVDRIAEDLPADLRDEWLARPDVAALREAAGTNSP